MKYFYGVRPENSALAVALGMIRYIAEPDSLRPSHITLRGPYVSPLEEERLRELNSDRPREWMVRLDGPGDFFNDKQSTVLIKVDLLDLKDLVWKPDFKGGQPHITLYDGKDRVFARELLDLLYRFGLYQDLPVSRLERLPVKKPVAGNFLSLYEDFNEAYARYLGIEHGALPPIDMSSSERLTIIEKVLLANFPTLYSRLSLREDLKAAQRPLFELPIMMKRRTSECW